MGGKDVVHTKQLQNSNLQSNDVQKLLKKLSDERFLEDTNGSLISNPEGSLVVPKVQRVYLVRPTISMLSLHIFSLSVLVQLMLYVRLSDSCMQT